MKNYFKQFVLMTFLCYVGSFFALNKDMAVNHHVIDSFNAYSLDVNNSSSEEELIKKCLAFQPLQDKIPANVKAQMNSILILNNNMNLSTSTDFEVEGKTVSVVSNIEEDSTVPYFLFNTLNIENGRAMVKYDFVFTDNGEVIEMSVTVEFGMEDSKWKEYNHYIQTKR